MRSVRVVDAGQPQGVFEALREALGGGGPTVVPREGGARGAVWPQEGELVAQNVALVI